MQRARRPILLLLALALVAAPADEEAAARRVLLDSAHHGPAMDPTGEKLCVAGTMSDYAAIVRRDDFSCRLLPLGKKPYWATNSADGRYCFVSWSGDDASSAISYRTGEQVARVPVGDHPQRTRMGVIRRSYLQ